MWLDLGDRDPTFQRFRSYEVDTKWRLFNIWPLSVTLEIGIPLFPSAHCLMMLIICAKLFQQYKIYGEKMLWTDRQTDGQTNKQTKAKPIIHTPLCRRRLEHSALTAFIFFNNNQYKFIRYARKTIIHWLPVKNGKSGSRVTVQGGNLVKFVICHAPFRKLHYVLLSSIRILEDENGPWRFTISIIYMLHHS